MLCRTIGKFCGRGSVSLMVLWPVCILELVGTLLHLRSLHHEQRSIKDCPELA
jgi:hypothetical protein